MITLKTVRGLNDQRHSSCGTMCAKAVECNYIKPGRVKLLFRFQLNAYFEGILSRGHKMKLIVLNLQDAHKHRSYLQT